ncbi:MAG: glycosyltransferase family 39 protein, partial [Anaerolineae bacterium]
MKLRSIFKTHPLAALIAAAFFTLALIYGIVTPPFEMSDESRHYAVVKYIADTGRLPVQQAGEAQRHWSHEGNQPPLYYALAALLTGRIETGGWNDVYWYNPHTSAGVPLRTDNENMTIHTAREAFPWRGYTLAVHLIRILSSLMGLATVIFTYRIALLLFNDHRPLAAAATAVAAFTPMFIFISAAVNNDNLVILFCTLATWLLVKMAQRGTRPADALWLGTLVGLGALSKLYALGLVPLALLLLLWQGFRGRQWRQFWRHSLLFGGMVILLAGWFYVRNLILYGDLLTVNLMTGVAGSRDAPLTLPTFLAEFEGLRIAYWALFGGVNVLAHPWIYRLLDAVSLAAAAGLAGLAGFWLWKRRLPHPARANSGAIFILAGWLAIMTAGFLVWNLNLTAAQGRLFFPAIAAISCLLVLGLGGWLPPRWAHRPPAVLAAGLFLFAAASPWLYIRPAYAKPPRLTP